MNIIEASKCGRRIRPSTAINSDGKLHSFHTWEHWKHRWSHYVCEHIDSDWEVEERKVEVTESYVINKWKEWHIRGLDGKATCGWVLELLGLRD